MYKTQDGAIGALVERVRVRDAEAVLAWLSGRSVAEVGSEILWQDTVHGAEPLAATLIEGYADYLGAVQSGAPPEVVLVAFERRRSCARCARASKVPPASTRS